MIIIMGDSWGVGEWGLDKDRGCCLTGPGIGQLLALHNKVINFSEGAADNFKQQQEFERLLAKFNPDDGDQFYWIVTDPLRNIIPSKLLETASSIESAVQELLNLFFKNINFIASNHKITINLIGGLCDLEPISYSNLKVVVPSWCKMLNANHKSSIFIDHTIKEIAPYITAHRPDLKHEWTVIAKTVLDKRKSVEYLESRGLIVGGHPTRQAHRLLRDYLLPGNENIF
jgi:hypothetical protein